MIPGVAAVRGGSLWILFAAALAVRLAYTAIHYAALGPDGLMAPDSYHFLSSAASFVEAARAGALHGWDWLGPDTGLMPMHLWLLSAAMVVTGDTGPLAPAMVQGAMDAATCVVVARIASTFDRGLAATAGWFAVFTPTLVVMSGLTLNDTMFLLACALALWAALSWMRRGSWRWALILGAALGLAAMTRVVIVPWALAILGYLGLVAAWRGRLAWRNAAQLAVALVLAVALFSPIPARNYDRFDALALTSQSGTHLLLWVVPLTMEVRHGLPHEAGASKMLRQYAERADAEDAKNPFRRSAAMASLGIEVLGELGARAIIKAWAYGAAINLFTPAVTLAPAAARLPRTGFYATPGESKLAKMRNFVFDNDNPLYAWLLGLGILGVVAARAVQFAGLLAGLSRDPDTLFGYLLLLAWIAFILLANGPAASPKYRLPIEPALAVFFAVGFRDISARLARRRAASQPRPGSPGPPPPTA